MGLPFFFSHQQTAIWKGRKNPSFRGRSNDHHGTINHIRPSWVPILQVAKERANSQRSLHGGSIRFCPRICPGKHAIWKIDIPYPLLPKFHPCYMFIWQMWSYKKKLPSYRGRLYETNPNTTLLFREIRSNLPYLHQVSYPRKKESHGSLMISKEENPKVFRKQTTQRGVLKGCPSKMGTLL